jgi:hypothetical protein
VLKKFNIRRYVDNFILELISNKKFGIGTLCGIANFSHFLGMTLNLEKLGVKYHEKSILFLGFKIFGGYGFNQKWCVNKDGRSLKVGDVVLKFDLPL